MGIVQFGICRKSIEVQFQTESVWWATLNAAERQELCEFPQQSIELNPDVLVIGGGIVGLATAYFAAEKGWKVQILSNSSRLAEDAEGTLGCIFPNAVRWQLSPLAQQLAQTSRDWWARLAVRPDFQVDWRVSGAVLVDELRLMPRPRDKMFELLEEGYSVRDVDAEQIAILEPQLRPLPVGGLHFPSEAVLHPLKAAVGFVRGIRRFKGNIATSCQVRGIERQGDRITSVETDVGRIKPKFVIADQFDVLNGFSSGAESPKLQIEGVQRRDFLATAPTHLLLNRPVLGREWLLQLKSGEIVMEAISKDLEAGASSDLINESVNSAAHLLPELSTAPFIRHWSAMYSTNADLLPTIDYIEGAINSWNYRNLAGAHVLLAPIIGRLLTQWMSSQQRPDEFAPFTTN